MIEEIKYAAQNSLVLVTGSSHGELPPLPQDKIVSATQEIILIGTMSSQDGDTSITLTNEEIETSTDSKLHIAYRGHLDTPNREISVRNIFDEIIIKLPTATNSCEVSVWVNDDSEPDKLVVCFL